ncbi:hypothetical protein BDF21DRAFT_426938 [Thamnidium elegans]|nr:hypothetical protein BDF21DRAFT_426938 [Thamnidium elegans]
MMDHGSLKPLDLYNKNDAYDLTTVRELILSKKLAPFYKGLSNPFVIPIRFNKKQKDYMLYLMNKEKKLYDKLYSNSVECPICFLFYPANINFARCCDQPICTECFVQIKRGPADYNHPSASNVVCPYCMTPNFGIIYQTTCIITNEKVAISTTSGISDTKDTKRKSIDSNHPDVVLIDHVIKQHDKTSSLHQWFRASRSHASIERYLNTTRVHDIQDLIVIESMHQSLI